MDMETENLPVHKPVMTKEQLQDSLSCRFCGYWSNVKESSSNVYFVPIFGLAESLQENLNILINRYLPIKVFDTDQYYPRFLCSTCVHDFKQTITFFNKIAAGQKILHEIINFTAPLPPPPDPGRMTFSTENPITQAIPRKRGRPKKDPFQLPKVKPVIPEGFGKPRRTIRAPGRYGSADCTEVSIRLEVEESPTPEIRKNKRPILYEDLLKKGDAKDVGAPMDTQSEFTSVSTGDNSVLDITRLSVIMDGDDEEPDNPAAAHPNSDSENVQPKTVDSYDIFVLPDYPVPVPAPAPPEEEDPTDMDFKVEITKNNKIKVKRGRGRPRKKKRKPKRIIQCPLCDKSFGHPSSLRYHRITAHETSNSKKFPCEVCDRVFKHKNLLRCHMLAHSNRREFQCDQCTKAFKSRNSLQTHVKVIHLGVKFNCELCSVQFSFKSSLIAHMRLHKGEKPFLCEYCNKAFTQKSNLDEHLRVHTNKRPYECTICSKTFKTASQFRSHKFIHAEEKSFLCSICGKSFTTADHFKYHMRRHNGEQPIECSVCNRKFVEPYALTKHMRIHTGSKPYHCKICDRNFGDGSNFKKHMQRHGDYAPSSSGGQKGGKTRPRPPKLQGRVLELYTKSIAEVEEAEEAEAAGNEPSSSHPEAEEPDVGRITRKQRFFKNSEPLNEDQIQIRDVFSQGILTGDTLQPDDSEVLTEEDGSLVQILNAEGLLENSSQDGQVIYVYPDDLPIFTITLNDNQQAIEVRTNDETTLQALGNLTGGPITFATVDGSDLGTQYFNLESVDGTTLTVPSESSVGDMGEGMNLGALIIPDSGSAGQTTLQLLQPGSIATSISGHSSSTDMNH